MKLLVISYKEIYPDPASPSGFSSTGGFPFQMKTLSELFDQTWLLLPRRVTPPPANLHPLSGHSLSIQTLPEPAGTDLRRKLALLPWLPHYLPVLWRAIRTADVVHAPVPGDIGLLGILLALVQRKRLFVRHCGTWGKPVTFADRFILWLLERIAGGRNVVLATGGADHPPSTKNPHIQWIFSSTLTQAEILANPAALPWQPSAGLHLVTVGRLSPEKNIQAILQALPAIRFHFPGVTLDVLGDGAYRPVLETWVQDLGLSEHVVFHGNVSHQAVLETLARSHLFVFPSLREGFPKALLEAMACGLPVVASDVSVIPSLISDCGKVLPFPDKDHLASTILELMKDPPALALLGENARRRATAYTLEAWQEQIAIHLRHAWGRELHGCA
jgi:glycosyltransferase involved in cell wall biosynthesis